MSERAEAATTYRKGDKVRVNPTDANPFSGTVEEVGGRTVSVRATVTRRASTWTKERVELLVPAPPHSGSTEADR